MGEEDSCRLLERSRRRGGACGESLDSKTEKKDIGRIVLRMGGSIYLPLLLLVRESESDLCRWWRELPPGCSWSRMMRCGFGSGSSTRSRPETSSANREICEVTSGAEPEYLLVLETPPPPPPPPPEI